MELIQPDFGLVIWMMISFLIVLFILRKAAWKPILKGIKQREDKIDDALSAAEKAKEEMEKLKVENKQIIEEAINERDKIISEAKEIKTRLLNDANENARIEAHKIIEQAKTQIESEKIAAIIEIKEHLVGLSMDIAEKVIKEKLKGDKEQEKMINEMLKDIKLN
jgi:F-type H+-transporting ATPase subunit b